MVSPPVLSIIFLVLSAVTAPQVLLKEGTLVSNALVSIAIICMASGLLLIFVGILQ